MIVMPPLEQHPQLAYAAFVVICGGTILHLIAAQASTALIVFQSAVFVFLIYLYFGPEIFDNSTLFRSLAFCEWMLCADCGVALLVLARLLSYERIPGNRAVAKH